jgi:hypothetical protein
VSKREGGTGEVSGWRKGGKRVEKRIDATHPIARCRSLLRGRCAPWRLDTVLTRGTANHHKIEQRTIISIVFETRERSEKAHRPMHNLKVIVINPQAILIVLRLYKTLFPPLRKPLRMFLLCGFHERFDVLPQGGNDEEGFVVDVRVAVGLVVGDHLMGSFVWRRRLAVCWGLKDREEDEGGGKKREEYTYGLERILL